MQSTLARYFARSLALAVAIFFVGSASAEYLFRTVAGSAGNVGSSDGTGSGARFTNPAGTTVDASGNIYVADTANHTVRKVSLAGVVTTLAGSPGLSGSSDGTGSAARFSYPWGLAVDPAGNVYVCDSQNHTIRKITPTGVVTTFAGAAGINGSADGMGTAARFDRPSSLAIDTNGNLFVADYGNTIIRKITPQGAVTTFAGLANQHGTADGTGSAARFNYPDGIAVDKSGNVFVSDTNNHIIRKITPAGAVTTLAGMPLVSGTADGVGTSARFNTPVGIAVDARGYLFVTDRVNHTIREISPQGRVATIGGQPAVQGSKDGVGRGALFGRPIGIAVDSLSNIVVIDTANYTVRMGTTSEGNGIADFDGDGMSELIWRAQPSTGLSSTTGAGANLSFGDENGGWHVINSGDFDGDGRTELLWRNTATTQISTWPMAGGYYSFGTEAGGWRVIGTGDFDGDGRSELLWRNIETAQVSSWPMAGGYYSFGSETDGWRVINIGDFDGDLRTELLWRNSQTTQISAWTMAGGYMIFGTEQGGWIPLEVGDFDGDFRQEILWRNTQTTQVSTWTMAGAYLMLGDESTGWRVIKVGDMDGDGRAEAIWRNINSTEISTATMSGATISYGTESAKSALVVD